MEESSEKWDAYDEESSEDEELDTSLIDVELEEDFKAQTNERCKYAFLNYLCDEYKKILPDGADSEEDSHSDGGIDDTEGGNEHDLGDEGGVHAGIEEAAALDLQGTASVNVSTSSSGGRSEYVNAGHIGGSSSGSSLQNTRYKLILIAVSFVPQLSVIAGFS
ncbi:hypothetical protein L1887_19026 [Cichorium endivia]|nr:hypothetical protein L1887_19026 [Cichorium endivia]